MDVSIIIPCYNKGKYLEECIDSVIMSNTDLEFEIIIVDDCSTDNSYEIAKRYSDQIDGIITLKNKKNVKQAATRNNGIKKSSGNFIICLDADDKIPPNYIQAHFDNIIIRKVDISYSNSQCFGKSDKTFNWPPYDINLLRKFPFVNCSAMYKRKVWTKVGGYDESFIWGSEDYDFWLAAAQMGFRFSKCEKTNLFYRIVDDGVTETTNHEHADETKQKLKKKYGKFYQEI